MTKIQFSSQALEEKLLYVQTQNRLLKYVMTEEEQTIEINEPIKQIQVLESLVLANSKFLTVILFFIAVLFEYPAWNVSNLKTYIIKPEFEYIRLSINKKNNIDTNVNYRTVIHLLYGSFIFLIMLFGLTMLLVIIMLLLRSLDSFNILFAIGLSFLVIVLAVYSIKLFRRLDFKKERIKESAHD